MNSTPVPREHGRELFEAGASFRVWGIGLDIERLSREFGFPPSHTHKLGELDQSKKPYAADMWYLNSPLDRNEKLEAHLNWLSQVLVPRKQYISSLKKDFKVDIYCFKTCYTEQASLTLSSQALNLFVGLQLELGVSLIFLPDEITSASTSSPPG